MQKKFTVILLYPDYFADNYGDTWCGVVEAEDSIKAKAVAQKQCADDQEHVDIMDLDDLAVIAVFEGAHRNLK